MSKRTFYLISLTLFIIYVVNGFAAIPQLSVTYDESNHLSYAIRYIKGHSEKVRPFDDASTMPVSIFNAIPRALEQILNKGLHKNDGGLSDITNGRYMTLVVCLLIGVFICKWTTELFGREAGLFSLFLFVFCPNLNANAWLVTTDAYTALFVLMTAYFFYRFVAYSGWSNFIAFSISIGLAQAVKQSLILLFLFFAVAALIVLVKRGNFFKRIRINFVRLLVFWLVVLFCINAAFLFNGTGKTLTAYNFYSRAFQVIQHWKLINNIPLPLPAPFIEGFDLVKYMLGLGSGHPETSPRSYLFGNYFIGKGPWYYYPSTILFKTPLSVLFLLFMFILTNHRNRAFISWAPGFTLTLSLFFVLSVILLNTSQHSIRHLILIYPLIYVSLGGVVQWGTYKKDITNIIILFYCASTFYYYFPNVISYTNELLWNKTKVYKTIASTNIDYGQGNNYLVHYLNMHKNVQWPGESPKAGTFILDINSYLDLRATGKYGWLRKFSPINHVNHCYLLFNITEQDLKEKNFK